jgi:ATP-dependent DNA helicase RecG
MMKNQTPIVTPQSIRFLKGVGPKRAKLFEKIGVYTIGDLLVYFPSKYYDRSKINRICNVKLGAVETIEGTIENIRIGYTKSRLNLLKVLITDGSGVIEAIWFLKRRVRPIFKRGDRIIVSGKIDFYKRLQIKPDEYEILHKEDQETIHTKGIIPAYRLSNNFPLRTFRKLIYTAICEYADKIPEIIPQYILKKRVLSPINLSLKNIHFPENFVELAKARKRLAYEELFLLQTALCLKKKGIKKGKVGIRLSIGEDLDSRIRALFPFRLTKSQEKVISEIKQDLVSESPMNRLLQGDVGSGKTVIAVYALLAAVCNGAQSAIMAPTELLAEQHYNTIKTMLDKSRARIALLSSSITAGERKNTLTEIQNGNIDLVIGTHAVIQKDVKFKNLGLVVIDEQHRFGVRQRVELRLKGFHPHTLVMTATPIPRTLALTLYGDLDVSVIDELPPGRKPIKTIFHPSRVFPQRFDFIKAKLREGRQAYFVYPLIDESDTLPLKSAMRMFGFLKNEFSEFRVALLHGETKKDERDKIMQSFRDGNIDILVSTIVIEVGIDVPNATIMVIENAERYGLAQLHQLRGRIGRGREESYCLLFGDPKTEVARQRLSVIAKTTDGFKIAEEDLRLRGPGEILGLRQSGLPEFKIADILTDFNLICQAREDAQELVLQNSTLSKNTMLKIALRNRFSQKKFALISVG